MKQTKVIHGLCARCGTEVKDVYPKFFLPTPKTNGKIRSSVVCLDCFKAYIDSQTPELVAVEVQPDAPMWVCQRCGANIISGHYPSVCPSERGGCGRLTDKYRQRRDMVPDEEDTAFKIVEPRGTTA